MEKPFIFTHIKHLVNFNIFDTKWIPSSAKFAALGGKSNGTGVLNVFELNDGKLELVTEIRKKSALKCGSFSANSSQKNHLAVADFDGRLQILDIERLDGCVYSVSAHETIVNSIDTVGDSGISNCGSAEIVTAGKDGLVKIWDPRQKDSPVACMVPNSTSEGGTGFRDCWSVCFGNSHNNQERFVCAGYDNGDLKIFDLRKMKVFWETSVRSGICCTEFDQKNLAVNRLAVTTVEGNLQVINFQESQSQGTHPTLVEFDVGRVSQNNGITNTLRPTAWCVRHLPQNSNLLATCGGAGTVKIWLYKSQRAKQSSGNQTDSLEMMQEVSLSKQPIHCFDWCSDYTGLAVCGSFDHHLRVLVTSNLSIS